MLQCRDHSARPVNETTAWRLAREHCTGKCCKNGKFWKLFLTRGWTKWPLEVPSNLRSCGPLILFFLEQIDPNFTKLPAFIHHYISCSGWLVHLSLTECFGEWFFISFLPYFKAFSFLLACQFFWVCGLETGSLDTFIVMLKNLVLSALKIFLPFFI